MAELYLELERKPRRFLRGVKLLWSELHLLETIGDQPGAGVTALAEILGVSKGAVSQTLKRLDGMGLIERRPDSRNLSRVCLYLSASGMELYRQHKEWHRKRLDGGLMDMMEEFSDQEGLFLQRAFDRFNQVLTDMIRLNK